MQKYMRVAVLSAILILFIAPLVISQFTKSQGRIFHGVKLEDTRYVEINFQNTAQGIRLGGMLFVPQAEGPFPAVVIIHGSGTSHRENGWYLTLTQYLQENGIVVLLPDKRGSEQSEGDWGSSSFEDLATDTWAAIAFLKEQEQVAISYIGVVGMSQGGHIAPMVASESSDVVFVVDVVGGAVPMHEALLYEENHNLREFGFLPGLSNLVAYMSTCYLRNIGQREFWNAVGNFDSLQYWEKLATSSLVMYGQEDTNVPSAESAARLRSVGNPHIRVKVYEGSGHALEDPEGEGNSIFREDALRDIRDFIYSVAAL